MMRLVYCILLFFIFSSLWSVTEASKLSHFSKEDQEKVEKLLSFLVWNEDFAYVLFGNKPMARVSQEKQIPSYYREVQPSSIYDLESLWKTWEKFQHLFPMEKFVFLTESNENLFSIYLFNKSNCLKVIEKNLLVFQNKKSCSLDPDEMFHSIISSGEIFKKGLNQSQALVGILFGYGVCNSIGFENYFSQESRKIPLPPEATAHIDTEDPIQPPIPFFTSFSLEETERLLADYRKQRDEILKIYAGRDFLEVTINRLTMKGL